MAPIKTVLRNALLFGLPLATALPKTVPQKLPSFIQNLISGGDDSVAASSDDSFTTSSDTSSVIEDIGDAVEGMVSVLSNILSNYDAPHLIPNRYIVVYNNTFDDDAISARQAYVSNEVKKRNLHKRSSHGHQLSTDVRNFKLNSWRATMLDADDALISDIFNSAEVEYIEADAQVTQSDIVGQLNAPLGLERLSHAQKGETAYIFDERAGEGITAYVVDTGVLIEHSEFGGRATFGGNFIDDVVSSLALLHLSLTP